MLPNYIKDFLDLEDVILTKTVHADKYVKFFWTPNPDHILVQSVGTPLLRFMIIVGRPSKIYPFS